MGALRLEVNEELQESRLVTVLKRAKFDVQLIRERTDFDENGLTIDDHSSPIFLVLTDTRVRHVEEYEHPKRGDVLMDRYDQVCRCLPGNINGSRIRSISIQTSNHVEVYFDPRSNGHQDRLA